MIYTYTKGYTLCMIPLYEISRIDQFIKTECRLMVSRGLVEMGNEKKLLN